jgi:hypothetical protein
VTGNDLPTGSVVWWTGTLWSLHIEEAIDVGDKGEDIAKREEAARRVNIPYVIDANPGPHGPVPAHIKDRIRATGPSVRPDLAITPVDESVGSYVI